MLRQFLFILVALMLVGAAGVHAQTSATINSDPQTGVKTLIPTGGIPPYKSSTEQDIYFDGLVADTTIANSFTLYGPIWRTVWGSGLPKLSIYGKDSATITPSFRHVLMNGNAVAGVGPWKAGSAITFRRALTLRDTLYHATFTASDSSYYLGNETGFVQYKYLIADLSVKKDSSSAVSKDRTSGKNHTWTGGSKLTWRRTDD